MSSLVDYLLSLPGSGEPFVYDIKFCHCRYEELLHLFWNPGPCGIRQRSTFFLDRVWFLCGHLWVRTLDKQPEVPKQTGKRSTWSGRSRSSVKSDDQHMALLVYRDTPGVTAYSP